MTPYLKVESLDTDRGVVAWFTRNRVAANLLMALIVVGGLLTIPSIKKEVFPYPDASSISVRVAYPGAAPEEVEEGICRRIEEEIQGLVGIDKVTSLASEGLGVVTVHVLPEEDLDRVQEDVKARVDAILGFPEEAEKPIISRPVVTRQVINVAIAGDIDEYSLKSLGERLRDDLLSLPGITKAELYGTRPYEISVEVSEVSLRRWGLSFDDVADAIRRSSMDLPGGTIKAEGGEILLRAKGQAYRSIEFEDVVLMTRSDGTRVTVGEVATVIDGFQDADISSRFDGKPSVVLQVFRVGDQSAFEVAALVRDYVETAKRSLPDGVTLTTWRDDSVLLNSRLSLLLVSAGQGLVLVFLILALFLRFRLAIWVTIGIPISFLGAAAVMPIADVSINMISLFAFIVVLGIVVDDAIVVGENVFEHLKTSESGTLAAIRGAKQVAVPVTFAVLTTVVAFSPMFDMPGTSRKIWMTIPTIVVATLIFSLIESKFVLPAHLSHIKPDHLRGRPHVFARTWSLIQGPFLRGLEWFIARVYRPTIEWSLRWRYVTLASGIGIFALTIGFVVSGFVKFGFFPTVEGDNVVALLKMPNGTPSDVTVREIEKIERAALELRDEIEAENHHGVIQHALATVGEQQYVVEQQQNQGGGEATGPGGSNLGEVNLQLAPAEGREISSEEVMRRWREKVGEIPGALELSFSTSLFSTGEDINVQLDCPDIEVLRKAAHDLKGHLATFQGVEDITDNFEPGKSEVALRIKDSAEPLGLTLEDLARQVRQGFYGEEVQRIQRGRDEVKVMVRYPESQRRSLGDLESMRIRTPDGSEVPFFAVAEVRHGQGYASIRRTDRARTVNVIASVDDSVANANEILRSLREGYLPELMGAYPGLRYTFEGDARTQAETVESLLRGFVIALIVIYGLMAIPFRSYVQPGIIMAAIPFGFVGAVFGHIVMGMEMSIMSMFGLVALSGVVVNDSLVLVDFVNRARAEGRPVIEAVRDGGIARFRPIVLTSLTTFAGLTPMLMEQSVQAKFLIPMAISLGFGVMFATFITLLLVPTLYLILEDLIRAFQPLRRAVGSIFADETDAGDKESRRVVEVPPPPLPRG